MNQATQTRDPNTDRDWSLDLAALLREYEQAETTAWQEVMLFARQGHVVTGFVFGSILGASVALNLCALVF